MPMKRAVSATAAAFIAASPTMGASSRRLHSSNNILLPQHVSCSDFEEVMKFEPHNRNFFQVEGTIAPTNGWQVVSIRCPHCRQLGSFQVLGSPLSFIKKGKQNNIECHTNALASMRICPNAKCRGLVFLIESRDHIVAMEPPELLDFDPEGLPESILRTLREAISCHAAGAHRATAMMVRRLLEEICELNNAEGANLHQRLEALKAKIVPASIVRCHE
ncbi:hypothetical protein C5688_20385 [Methylocystis sp. MitZ-2018]|nr:hypothetical protein C5688_20385 [Methylocystis sp. MitZ-2018]